VAEIGLGTASREDLLVGDEPILEVLDFSAPNVEAISGDFGMEIRVGYETGKDGRRAISGGSVTGNLFEAMANARFSADSEGFAQFAGPAAIRFESLQVAGED
jgi:PmbA protein